MRDVRGLLVLNIFLAEMIVIQRECASCFALRRLVCRLDGAFVLSLLVLLLKNFASYQSLPSLLRMATAHVVDGWTSEIGEGRFGSQCNRQHPQSTKVLI